MKKVRNYKDISKALEALRDKILKMKEDSELVAIEKELADLTPVNPIEKFTKAKPKTKLPEADKQGDNLPTDDTEVEIPESDELQNDTEDLIDNEEGNTKGSGELGGKKSKQNGKDAIKDGKMYRNKGGVDDVPGVAKKVATLKDLVKMQKEKLAPKVKTLEKGGPGSGRHAGSGKGEATTQAPTKAHSSKEISADWHDRAARQNDAD